MKFFYNYLFLLPYSQTSKKCATQIICNKVHNFRWSKLGDGTCHAKGCTTDHFYLKYNCNNFLPITKPIFKNSKQ